MPFPPKSNDDRGAGDPGAPVGKKIGGKKPGTRAFGKKGRKAAPIQKSMMRGGR